MKFDSECQCCKRSAAFLDDTKAKYPDYYCGPVPAFGDEKSAFLIVGLAPGLHGANATARPFTGDDSGALLYEALYQFGFSSAAKSVAIDDGLQLNNCRITNAVKCLPPENKPLTSEIKTCNPFLRTELMELPKNSVVLVLGGVAHNAVLRALDKPLSSCKFGHANEFSLEHIRLIDSYHCSRYNTQTKRLTPEMFRGVFKRVQEMLAE
ncbi:MAG: Uracil-DNA glycosylase, family 5 [uncultured Thiotrichaceae bacterium]|uniref:Type-5 uracil-DNA glycosylase n=1 Tax=uncultured Thiotrichaceae bacterium TaxID=298394 RepID=A0A6S6TGF8_9GAMM|nr:MAG: Uracil-DNA glycosylase, family 5 [uncultured Thiotrichaceae bacterium]